MVINYCISKYFFKKNIFVNIYNITGGGVTQLGRRPMMVSRGGGYPENPRMHLGVIPPQIIQAMSPMDLRFSPNLVCQLILLKLRIPENLSPQLPAVPEIS